MKKSPQLTRRSIIEAVESRDLIGDSLSPAQETALRALYGLPLSEEQFAIYQRATERTEYIPREHGTGIFVCGRRSGKSSKLGANIAIFEALFRKHELARGERGYVVVLAATRRQANVVFEYVLGRLESSRLLRSAIQEEPRADEVDLRNGITIAVWPANFRTIRGISVVCAICDEISYWFDDVTNANPASEIIRALKPGMAGFPTAKLVAISSPFAKSGWLWEAFRTRHERDDRFVWHLDTATMNPAIDPAFLAEEEKNDPEYYAREYLAEFWESAANFLPSDSVQACVVAQRFELPPQPGPRYTAALDAAFRGDAFAFSITHRTGEKILEDVIRSWRGSRSHPVNLAEVLGEIVSFLRRYRITRIFGDQFCSEPIRQALVTQGIQFEQRTTLGSRAQCFNSLRTLITSGQIELLDDAETVAELKRLQLVVTTGGNQRVEAATGHDDRAVALALAAHEAVGARQRTWIGPVVLNVHPDQESDGHFWHRIN